MMAWKEPTPYPSVGGELHDLILTGIDPFLGGDWGGLSLLWLTLNPHRSVPL